MQTGKAQKAFERYTGLLKLLGIRALVIIGEMDDCWKGKPEEVDVLVVYEGTLTFEIYRHIRLELEKLLGCPVDLVTTHTLQPVMLEFIEPHEIFHLI